MLTRAMGEVSSLSQNTGFAPACNKKMHPPAYFFITCPESKHEKTVKACWSLGEARVYGTLSTRIACPYAVYVSRNQYKMVKQFGVMNIIYKLVTSRLTKTALIWASVLWLPILVQIAVHWPPRADLPFDIEILAILFGVALCGSWLLSVLLNAPQGGFIAPLIGLFLGAILLPIAGFLWVLVGVGFEGGGIWIWGLIMGIPGALGGSLAAWSQWVSKTTPKLS